MTASKVLFIGVDAGDKDLILQWAHEGRLPAVRSLLERGMWGLTANPEGLFVGAVWPSFWTGLSPDHHGRYCYSQLRLGTYQHYRVTPRDTKGDPFWIALSQAGRRVAIIDVPKTAPSPSINGIQIVDWGTHDPELGFCTSPASLATEVESRFGKHPVGKCDARRQGASDFSKLRDALRRGVEQKANLASHFLEQGGWDLFVTVFAESHCVGHQCWHLHDAGHPRHDPEVARAVGDPIRDVYTAIDAAIGRLLRRVGDDTIVFVLASHGMGPHYDGTFLLNEILRRWERADVPDTARTIARVLETCRERLPRPVRRLLRPLRTRAKREPGAAVAGRRCFQTPNNDVYGGIRVNLVGREPHGLIHPGADYDQFCKTLSRDLLALLNVETGRPLVRRVLRTAEIYRGDLVETLPDLLVEWDRTSPISNIHSAKLGTISAMYNGIRTGDHQPDGLFVASGPTIAPAHIRQAVSVTQFAPTIASLLGIALPGVEAAPIPEVVEATGTSRRAAIT